MKRKFEIECSGCELNIITLLEALKMEFPNVLFKVTDVTNYVTWKFTDIAPTEFAAGIRES